MLLLNKAHCPACDSVGAITFDRFGTYFCDKCKSSCTLGVIEDYNKSVSELQTYKDSLSRANKIISQQADEARSLQNTIDQLRAQIHDLCHDLHVPGPVTPQEFCDGCEKFQFSIFGTSPIADLKKQIDELKQYNFDRHSKFACTEQKLATRIAVLETEAEERNKIF